AAPPVVAGTAAPVRRASDHDAARRPPTGRGRRTGATATIEQRRELPRSLLLFLLRVGLGWILLRLVLFSFFFLWLFLLRILLGFVLFLLVFLGVVFPLFVLLGFVFFLLVLLGVVFLLLVLLGFVFFLLVLLGVVFLLLVFFRFRLRLLDAEVDVALSQGFLERRRPCRRDLRLQQAACLEL